MLLVLGPLSMYIGKEYKQEINLESLMGYRWNQQSTQNTCK